MHKVAIFCSKKLKTSIESLNTVINLLDNLDNNKYDTDIIVIDGLVKDDMIMSDEQFMLEPCYISFSDIENHPVLSNIVNLEDLSLNYLRKNYDVAIIAIYNTYGEDGRLIGLLETAGIPYMSPSLKTSAICMDKSLTKKILTSSGIYVPPGFEVHKTNINIQEIDNKIIKDIGYPVIVKASYSGASKGINVVDSILFLENSINEALKYSEDVLFERFLSGEEFTVGITGHYTNPSALPIVMIKTNNKFFDYEAKYVTGKCEEICPANIDKDLTAKIQNIAIQSYQAVKAESHSRIDIILSNDILYVLEINTFPGLTKQSLFPRELTAAGITIRTFIDNKLDMLLHRNIKNE